MSSEVNGSQPDPLQTYRFQVTSYPYIPARKVGFQEVDGLSSEVEVASYREGDMNHTKKMPGKEIASDLTMKHGIDLNSYLYAWHLIVKPLYAGPNTPSGSGDGGPTAKKFRFPVYVDLVDRTGDNTIKHWVSYAAWPHKYDIGSLSTTGNSDPLLETAVFSNEGNFMWGGIPVL